MKTREFAVKLAVVCTWLVAGHFLFSRNSFAFSGEIRKSTGAYEDFREDAVLMPGEPPPDWEYPAYTGPSYPPGPAARAFSFSGLTGTGKIVSFDQSGVIGTHELLISTYTENLIISNTNNAIAGVWGTSVLMLRDAHISVSGYILDPGVQLLDQPTGMKMALWAESEDIFPEGTARSVNYGFTPVSSRKLVELSGDGYSSAAFNIPLRNSMQLKLVGTPNNNSVRYTYWYDSDGDGIKDTPGESVFAPGSLYLKASGGASVAYAKTQRSGISIQWLPAGPTRSVQLENVNVEIRNVTVGGNITVESARRTLKQPGYKMWA